MENTSAEIRITRLIQRNKVEMDRQLPMWARRSNPIIRRQLGVYWKTILPEIGFLRRMFIIQAVLIMLSLFWPVIFDLALPAITASILLFPFAILMYGNILLSIGSTSAVSMTHELQNDTFNLLRVTPFNLNTILASKIAAAIWKQVEDIGLLLSAAVLLSMPMLVSQYATLWPLKEYPLLSRTAMILGLAVSILRLVIEPCMIGAVGMLMGTALRSRAPAVLSTVFIGAFYFLMLNLTRLVDMPWQLRFVVDFVLPLTLPLLMIWGSFTLARWLISRN